MLSFAEVAQDLQKLFYIGSLKDNLKHRETQKIEKILKLTP